MDSIGVTVYGCDAAEADLFGALAPRFGVLPTITDAPLSEATAALAAGNRCVSIGHRTPVDRAALGALRRVGVAYLSTRSVGCDHVDTTYAERIGLRVGTVAYSPDSVADFTVMLILMAIRRARVTVLRSACHDYRPSDPPGRELRDLTVGVVGTGRIGTAVLERLSGFGGRVLTHDLRATPPATHVALDDLVSGSDVVTLHTPLTRDTHHLLDHARIGRMKPGAIVVNTGRGALVDTRALVTALEHGRLGGAALDVVEGETGIFSTDRTDGPVGNEALERLQRLPNVLITPHTAYYTDHALADIVENTLLGCVTFERENQHG